MTRRIAPMQPDNLPAGRRPPPDDDPPQPAAEPAPPRPAAPGRDLAPVPDVPESASTLASLLAETDKTDRVDESTGSGPQVPLSALTTPPPVDPDLDLVNLGARVPRYMAEAIRTQAFLQRKRQQDVVLAALRGQEPLLPELLDECRRSAVRGR